MRPYLILMAVVLMAAAAFGQQPFPQSGPCFYGCGPYVPMVTTPQISLQQASPNPVGATNATAGLIAGATNSTLSEIQGSTSSVYTVPVWYQGGSAPLITPNVHLYPEPIGREGHRMHGAVGEERAREERGSREEARAGWTYFSGREHSLSLAGAAGAGKGSRQPGHVYTNEDISRQNEKNGDVKYDGKAEKI
jgi:hypothetical protein